LRLVETFSGGKGHVCIVKAQALVRRAKEIAWLQTGTQALSPM
jgi:hypothetical protein